MSTKRKDKLEQVSHKVIEKRRRDRINNCLSELSQAVPAAFAKQSSGKLEKAEILEMTVEYLKAINGLGHKIDEVDWLLNPMLCSELQRHYAVGYGECVREVLHYITEVEGLPATDSRCVRMLTYLQHRLGSVQIVETSGNGGGGGGFGSIAEPLVQSSSPKTCHSPEDLPIVDIACHPSSSQVLHAKDIAISATSPQPMLHANRWSSTYCPACTGGGPSKPSSAIEQSLLTSSTDHATDYFGLQLVTKMTAPFYHHHLHHHHHQSGEIFTYNSIGDLSKSLKPAH